LVRGLRGSGGQGGAQTLTRKKGIRPDKKKVEGVGWGRRGTRGKDRPHYHIRSIGQFINGARPLLYSLGKQKKNGQGRRKKGKVAPLSPWFRRVGPRQPYVNEE